MSTTDSTDPTRATKPDRATPHVTAWADKGDGYHRRDVGAFAMFVSDRWARDVPWSVEWGHEIIAEGKVYVEPGKSRVDALDRAKAACDEAARRAGIAVPR